MVETSVHIIGKSYF